MKIELESAAFAPDRLKVDIHLPAGYESDFPLRYQVLYLDDGQDAIGKVINDAIRVCGQRWVMREGIAGCSRRYFPLGRYWFDDSFAYRFSIGRR